MIDHVGFPVSDYARAKAFYEKALAPLGYTLIMEVQQNEQDAKAAGFGANGKPDFWIGGEGGLEPPRAHRDRGEGPRRCRRVLPGRHRGGRDGQRRARPAAHYHANYYGAFVLDPDGHNIEAVCHAPG